MNTAHDDHRPGELRQGDRQVFEKLRALVQEHRSRGDAFLSDHEAKRKCAEVMAQVEEVRSSIQWERDATLDGEIDKDPKPWSAFEREIWLAYDEFLPIFESASSLQGSRLLDDLPKFRPPQGESTYRRFRNWWRAAAKFLQWRIATDRDNEIAFLEECEREFAEAQAREAAAVTEPPAETTSQAASTVPTELPAAERHFVRLSDKGKVQLSDELHVLATEIDKVHRIPLSTLDRWIDAKKLASLGRFGTTRVFDRAAFLECKREWLLRKEYKARIDANRCETA